MISVLYCISFLAWFLEAYASSCFMNVYEFVRANLGIAYPDKIWIYVYAISNACNLYPPFVAEIYISYAYIVAYLETK